MIVIFDLLFLNNEDSPYFNITINSLDFLHCLRLSLLSILCKYHKKDKYPTNICHINLNWFHVFFLLRIHHMCEDLCLFSKALKPISMLVYDHIVIIMHSRMARKKIFDEQHGKSNNLKLQTYFKIIIK